MTFSHGQKVPVVTRRDPWDDRRIASREIRAPRAVRPKESPCRSLQRSQEIGECQR